jgi:hypothetical protein
MLDLLLRVRNTPRNAAGRESGFALSHLLDLPRAPYAVALSGPRLRPATGEHRWRAGL